MPIDARKAQKADVARHVKNKAQLALLHNLIDASFDLKDGTGDVASAKKALDDAFINGGNFTWQYSGYMLGSLCRQFSELGPSWVEFSRHSKPEVRNRVATLICETSETVFSEVIPILLADRSKKVRLTVAHILSVVQRAEAAEFLRERLSHESDKSILNLIRKTLSAIGNTASTTTSNSSQREESTKTSIPLFEATEYFEPFPAPEAVFAKDIERHMEFLLPLASVSLSHINSRWSGKLHFVIPIEPTNGVVGEETTQFHTYLCRSNWIGYKVSRKWKYSLDADFRYFVKADVDQRSDIKLTKESLQALHSHYKSTRSSYEKRLLHFEEHGALHAAYARRRKGRYSDNSRMELAERFGGYAGWGNWAESSELPLSRHEYFDEEYGEDDVSPLPQAEDGSDFVFIGGLPAYSYCEGLNCTLLLFYHRKKRLALTTFDWI